LQVCGAGGEQQAPFARCTLSDDANSASITFLGVFIKRMMRFAVLQAAGWSWATAVVSRCSLVVQLQATIPLVTMPFS
jgi:hypothetical protein